MRNKLLLVLAGSLLSLSSYAQWFKPTEPKLSSASVFVPSEEKGSGDTYYLWNVESAAFLGEGNDWNVRATLNAEKGLEFYFQKYKINDVWQEGNYIFNTYTVANQSGRWDYMWIPLDNVRIAYTDYKEPGINRGYGDDMPLWSFQVFADEYLIISTGSKQPVWNEADQGRKFYLGKPYDGEGSEEGNTIIYPDCTEDDNIYWQPVTKADYEAYQLKLQTYYVAMSLKDAIELSESKYPGINLDEVKTVYNNGSSTKEQLQAAIDRIPELEKIYASNSIGNASVDNPFDATAYIVNPNYDGNVDGWTGLSTSWYNTVGEKWSDNSNPYDVNQTINELPNGVYEVQVYSTHRIGNADWDQYQTGVLADDAQYRRTSQIYANNYWKINNDVTDALTTEPIHGEQYYHRGDYFFPDGQAYTDKAFNEYGMYNNSLFVAVTDGTLKIGVRCENREQYSWTSFDTWRLTYYGDSNEALELMKTHLLTNLKDYSNDFIQATLVEEYNTAIEALKAAADYATVEENYTKAIGLFYDMEKSRNAYNSYIALAESILPQTQDLDCEANDILLDYLEGDTEGTYGYILENTNLTIEELAAQEEWLRNQLSEAIKNTVAEGRDYTNLIANADFTQRDLVQSGWTLDNWKGQTIVGQDGTSKYYVAEVWNYKSFDLYQTLTGMPQGIYEVTIPALYRACDNDYTHPATAEIYINGLAKNVMKASEGAVTNETAISAPDGYPNWESIDEYNCYNQGSSNWDGPWPNDYMNDIDGVTMYWPGSTGGAGIAFNAGRYENKVYGMVGEDGILRFGIRSKNQSGQDNDWVCLGRITMKYMGSNQMALAGLKEEAASQADIYYSSADKFYQGYRDEIINALLNVEKANTKDEIITAINEMNELFNKINTSISLYKELNKLVSADGVGLYAAAARTEDVAAMERAEEYIIGMENCSYDNEKAEQLIAEVSNDPLVDIIYVRGGLLGYDGDDFHSFEFPMTRQADGTYKGTAKFRDERHGDLGKYAGNRALVVFHRLGEDICAVDHNEQFLNENPAPRQISINDNSNWFLTWGGEWEFTIDLTAKTMVCMPVGEMLYKNQIYAVGNLLDNNWSLNESTALNWQLVHQGNGIYQGSVAFNPGVERGEVTLFASDMFKTNNWGDGRIGSADDQLPLESGQEVACDRFRGDRKWILTPGHHYLATYDVNKGTVRFDVRDLQGDDTEASPLLINDFEDLLMMRSYLRQGETHYFALTNSIDMSGRGWSQPNAAGEQNGKEGQRWISFDGRGHLIAGFNGDNGLQSKGSSSFFGILGGSVKNLGFTNAKVTQDEMFLADYGVTTPNSVAVLASVAGTSTHADATVIENCFVEGSLEGGLLYAAPLVASVNGPVSIKNVYANTNVKSEAEYTAGLIGRFNGAVSLENAYAAGTVSNSTPIFYDFSENAPSVTLKNVVNWTNYSFSGVRSTDTATNIYNYNGSNFADLQNTVVAFDPAVWSCGMGADEYPVLSAFAEEITGVQSVKNTFVVGTKVYTLGGVQVSNTTSNLPAGIYIIKNGSESHKVVIK